MIHNKAFCFILACITIFIWGITFVCTKYLLNSFSSFEILFIRYFMAYIALFLMNPRFLKTESFKEESLFILAGLTGVTIYQFLENIAINYTNASNVSIIVSICPFFTAIVAQIVLKEKHLNWSFILGFIIAISGVALVSFNGKVELNLNPKGDILALISGISWAFYSLYVSKINQKNYNIFQSTRRIFFWSLIFMIPIAITGKIINPDFITFDKQTNLQRFSDIWNIVNLVFLGIGASAFCFASWNIACNTLGTVKTSLGIYMIPVVTVIFSFLFLHEQITILGGIGCILTISGLFISEIKKKSSSQTCNSN